MRSKIAGAISRWNYCRLFGFPHDVRFTQGALKDQGYSSQSGQDKWIAETLLPGTRLGVFVDIGAHDGITFSNTLYLETQLGWNGLAVEPIPEVFDRLRLNRRCAVSNLCVAAKPGKSRFQVVSGYPEMLSGIVSEYEERHVERIRRELNKYGGSVREIEVECCTLSELIAAHGITTIDYLSIDVEGAEHSILDGFDFDGCQIRVIGVENNYRDRRIPRLLMKEGFRFHSIVGDEFYVRDGPPGA